MYHDQPVMHIFFTSLLIIIIKTCLVLNNHSTRCGIITYIIHQFHTYSFWKNCVSTLINGKTSCNNFQIVWHYDEACNVHFLPQYWDGTLNWEVTGSDIQNWHFRCKECNLGVIKFGKCIHNNQRTTSHFLLLTVHETILVRLHL